MKERHTQVLSEKNSLASQVQKLKEKLKNLKDTNEILQNDLVQHHMASEKQRKKYESELKNLRGAARMSENE